MKELFEGHDQGDVYAMVWSPTPTDDRSWQYGHKMLVIKPVLYQPDRLDFETEYFSDQSYSFKPYLWINEAGTSVNKHKAKWMYGRIETDRRDWVIFKYKLNKPYVKKRYEVDPSFKMRFNGELFKLTNQNINP